MKTGALSRTHLFTVFAQDDTALRRRVRWLLVGITAAVYWRVCASRFINYDDATFVIHNPHVYTGLSFENVLWALTTLNGGASSYHPITWLTHQLDCQLFGLRAGVHHLTNLWLHIANTALLFTLLEKATGKLWRSAFIAAMFALHPMHIETVAWISDRKTLVCVFFWLLTTLVYVRYTRDRSPLSYLLVLLAYAASLLSKPIAVSLPITLIALDYWPLNRLESPGRPSGLVGPIFDRLYRMFSAERMRRTSNPAADGPAPPESSAEWPSRLTLRRLLPFLIEKIPLFILSGMACVITIIAQKELGATASLREVPMWVRLNSSVVAYLVYLRKMIWPADLAPIYPLQAWPWWEVAGCGTLLLLVSAYAFWEARRRPYLLVGWCWYLVTLLPTIGLVQVGSQGMADRYSYVPLLGVFLLLTWEFCEGFEKSSCGRRVLSGAAAGIVAACAICTFVTVGYWQNSVSLFEHAIRVTKRNYIAYCQLGLACMNENKVAEAKGFLVESLRINPHQPITERELGEILFSQGDSYGAVEHYVVALNFKPNDAETHAAMAELLDHSKDSRFLNPLRAVGEARLACELSHYRDRTLVVQLATICAENNLIKEACVAAQKALELSVAPQDIQSARQLLADVSEKEKSNGKNPAAK